ncbi:hypothetical protein BCR34DRAFT_498366, partial [Clohesyomyces aquaticus]
LNVLHPQIRNPAPLKDSECTICFQDLVAEEICTSSQHRPIALTCDQVFGYSCFQEWFREKDICPMCLKDFSSAEKCEHSPEEFIASHDRVIRWNLRRAWQAGIYEPHSHLDMLVLILGLTDEVRREVPSGEPKSAVQADVHESRRELIVLAGDRLGAVLEGDVDKFRKIARF